jgi:GNAT superfamily N-acetyltransferase
MRFELTEALIKDMLFSMEDQNGEFFLDTHEGVVIGGFDSDFDVDLDDDSGDRYLALPAWDSAEGFRLMERFTAGLKNPLIQTELTAALTRGKGVFRAFKDALIGHPEAEQRWFVFKEREMRQILINWYNALREEWGLERIGREPEETGDLVLEDFRFRDGTEQDAALAAALHQQARNGGEEAESGWVFPGSLALVAETGTGDFAAYAAAEERGAGGAWRITAIEVDPQYRGLGIGKSLLGRLLERLRGRRAAVTIELPSEFEGFSRALLRESFTPCSTRYRLELDKEGGLGAPCLLSTTQED